jgi:hypothetical protein
VKYPGQHITASEKLRGNRPDLYAFRYVCEG